MTDSMKLKVLTLKEIVQRSLNSKSEKTNEVLAFFKDLSLKIDSDNLKKLMIKTNRD